MNNSVPIADDLTLLPNGATIVSVLKQRAALHPDKTAFSFLREGTVKEVCISYAGLEIQAGCVASKLNALGLKGQAVLMFFPSGLDFVSAFFGCLCSGVIPVPVFPPRKNRSLQRIHAIASDCAAKAILTTSEVSRSMERNFSGDPVLNNLPWHSTDLWVDSAIPCKSHHEPGFEDLAFLQYTSGSTGNPKGVMVSHRNIMYNLRSIQLFFNMNREDIIVNWVPQFHDLGLIFGILETVFSGSHTVLIPPVSFLSDPMFLLRAISRYHATICGQPDFAFNLCVEKTDEDQRAGIDLSSLRVFYSGAEPVRKLTLGRFFKAFSPAGLKEETLFPGYGMAESTLILTGKEVSQPPFFLAVSASALEKNTVIPPSETGDTKWITSNGKPKMDTRIIIVDPEKTKQLPEDLVGEIWASGSTVTMGYFHNPHLTDQVFHATLPEYGASKWLRTGDLGFLHDGDLFITGRLKDLIIIRGSNFYPQDIEDVIESCHHSVRKTCTAAISYEDNGAERLVIVAELRRTILPHDTEKIMDAITTEVFNEFEIRPSRITLIRFGSIPKTSSGKIMRSTVRDYLLNGKFDIIDERFLKDDEKVIRPTSEIPSSSLEEFVVSWISSHLNKGSPVDLEKQMSAYGLDSLKAVELSAETKNIFGFEWPPYLFFEEISIRQMILEGEKMIGEMKR